MAVKLAAKYVYSIHNMYTFPPVFSWDWDGKRLIFVGVGRERFENSLPCHPLVCVHLL